MIVVTNSSPLVSLARINQFCLLHLLYNQICIPPAVREEVVTFGQSRPGTAEVETAEWIQVINVQNQTVVESFREQLDRGESEAIALAMELEADLLVIDEARGRQVARSLRLNIVGTVGTLVQAKQRGLIPAVTPLLDELMLGGFRMNMQLYQTAQQLAGELD